MEVKKNIFRTYDIRGVYPTELDENTAKFIGKAFASMMKEKKQKEIIVGNDNRISSEALSKALIEGIISTGMNVINIGTCLTPMTYFAREILNIKPSIMVTASHNPKEYNGFKICALGTDVIYGEEILNIYQNIQNNKFRKAIFKGKVKDISIKDEYVNYISSKVVLGDRKLKVALDTGSGAGSYFVKDVFESLGVETVYYACDPDGNFPIHHPDPSQEKNMIEFEKFVVENKCDVGLAFDGDADRVIAFDENGKILFGDEYAVIIWRDIIKDNPGAKAILDVKSSASLYEEIERLGGKPEFCKVGSPLIKAEIRKQNILFAAEYAGHVYFNDEHFGYDDAMYGGARLLRILSNTDKKMSELSMGAMNYVGTPEIIYPVTDENKFNIVEKVKEKFASKEDVRIVDIDGMRVIWNDNSWGLVRASNTGPNLTIKGEAKTIERANEIVEEIKKYVEEVK